MTGKGRSAPTPSSKGPRTPSSAATTSSCDDDADDTACEICRSPIDEAGNSILLCENTVCNRGYHQACLKPPLAKVPAGAWYCPLCEDLRRTDEHFKTTARVRVWWERYGDWYTGWVVNVAAANADEVKGAACGRPVYEVFYDAEDVQWSTLKPSDFVQIDAPATALAKEGDPLVGRRIEVWHAQSAAVVEGWYPGYVSDVRVDKMKRFAETALHLVRYDAGDVQVCGCAGAGAGAGEGESES